MNVKIQGGGSGTYSNSGSCVGVTNYLQHEDIERTEQGQEREQFFTHDRNVSPKEATYKIDHNKGQLSKKDSKFFVITVSPSEKEIKAMGATTQERSENFKKYINENLMQKYAEGFGKGLNNKDLMYFAKVHHDRQGKTGENMHAHIIVSRKDINNKIKISPQTNHRSTGKNGTVKGGFDRTKFFKESEQEFDKAFSHQRDFKETFDYQNTMKNGNFEDVKDLQNKQAQHNQEQEKIQSIKESLELQQEQEERTTSRGYSR